MSKPNPTYYAIITADVRYDNDLVPNAKLLYGEITALSNTTGECTAGNNYFAKLYDVKPTTVSEWVSLLKNKGYVSVFVDQANGNKRTIRIKTNTSSGKAEDPSSGKAEDNNTSNNNINPTLATDSQITKAYRLYLKYFIVIDDYSAVGLAAAEKRYRLTPKRKAAIERRLKDADPKMVMAAIVGYGHDEFYSGQKTQWKADLADFICRSYENIEKGARLYEEQRKRPGDKDDAWAKL